MFHTFVVVYHRTLIFTDKAQMTIDLVPWIVALLPAECVDCHSQGSSLSGVGMPPYSIVRL
jgi:hypothetical protein